jgi:organic radical activating enzyme
MEFPEILERFKASTVKQIVKMPYETFSITGGEPTLQVNKVNNLVDDINYNNPNAKIYIYTNGINWKYIIDWIKIPSINGINISLHPTSTIDLQLYLTIYQRSSYFLANKDVQKIRWRIEDNDKNQTLIKTLKYYTDNVKLFKLGECEPQVLEDWYIV